VGGFNRCPEGMFCSGRNMETRTSGAKALIVATLGGTAEAVPFVRRWSFSKKAGFGIRLCKCLVRGSWPGLQNRTYETVDYTEVHPEQRRIEQD
jgi:hypothetical protein